MANAILKQEMEYAEFMHRPLFTAHPISESDIASPATRRAYLERAAQALNCRNFEQFRTFRHREWLLGQIPKAMAKAESTRKDNATGQFSMFETF